MLKSTTLGKNKKRKSIKANQPHPQTRPQTRQQSQAQPEHAFVTPTRGQREIFGEEGQNVSYTQVRRTRGITQGLGTQALINACKHRIPIRTNGEHKLPQTVRANIKFRSEIGIQTRQNAPLMVKRWKEVSAVDKATITKALAIKFDFDDTDPVIKKFIEAHMSKSYSLWRSRLNKHYKEHAYDPEYARAHPPEKLFYNRQMFEWEWLCDELFTDEAYQKRCKINSANRNKQEYDHLESSPPYPKHVEAAAAAAPEMPVESTKKDSDYDDDDVDDNGNDDDYDDDDDDDDVDYAVDDAYVDHNDHVDVIGEDDVERNLEVDVDNVEEHGNQSVSTNTDKSSGKRKISSFTNVRGESSKKRLEIAEQRFTDSAPLRGNDEVQSVAKEVSDEEYLMQCFGILNKMDEIDDDSYSKALKLFRGDATWRKLFVGMPEKRRKNFILNLFCS